MEVLLRHGVEILTEGEFNTPTIPSCDYITKSLAVSISDYAIDTDGLFDERYCFIGSDTVQEATIIVVIGRMA